MKTRRRLAAALSSGLALAATAAAPAQDWPPPHLDPGPAIASQGASARQELARAPRQGRDTRAWAELASRALAPIARVGQAQALLAGRHEPNAIYDPRADR